MRKIYLVLILILITSGAFAQEGLISDNLVILKYNEINGLNVDVIWRPNELRNGYAIGAAIIRLTNTKYGTSSTVVSNNFGILQNRLDRFIKWKENENGENKIQSITSKDISLHYKNPKIPEEGFNFGTEEEPFFFYDIDFDGKDDLLVSEMYAGQRFYPTFKAYKLCDSQNICVIEDQYNQITYKEPYILLDGLSAVSRKNKTIEINYSSGAADSTSEVYEAKPSYEGSKTNEFVLKKIVSPNAE